MTSLFCLAAVHGALPRSVAGAAKRLTLRAAGACALALASSACALPAMLGGDALSDDQAALRAMNADVQPRLLVEDQLLAAVVAAGTAANLTGASDFVTTGTLDARGAEPSYSPSPDDALVLREQDHDTRYLIDTIAVSEVSSVEVILLHDHEVRLRAIRDDAFDLDLASVRSSDALERSAEGIFDQDGFRFELELDESGSSAADISGDIVRYDSSNHTESRVTGAQLDVEVAEDEDYILILSDNAYENRSTRTTLDATVSGKELAMDEGLVRRSFVNAAPAEPEFWSETGGTLELDGEVQGELAFEEGEGGAYEILLKLQGDDEVLERWTP